MVSFAIEISGLKLDTLANDIIYCNSYMNRVQHCGGFIKLALGFAAAAAAALNVLPCFCKIWRGSRSQLKKPRFKVYFVHLLKT